MNLFTLPKLLYLKMFKGHVDISHIDDEMLHRLKFVEHTNTVYSAGYWDRKGVAVLDYPMMLLGLASIQDDCLSIAPNVKIYLG